jgi:hypothetical protein
MEVSPKCYDAAKMSLQTNIRCHAQFNGEDVFWKKIDYVNWSVMSQSIVDQSINQYYRFLLYPAFTPFVVMFIHAIATYSTEDIQLLRDTVRTLHDLRDISQGARRLYSICKALLDTVEVLSKSQQSVFNIHERDDGSLVFSSNTAQEAYLGHPDFVWPEDMSDLNVSEIDMSNLFNNWLGANRPVTDILDNTSFDQMI